MAAMARSDDDDELCSGSSRGQMPLKRKRVNRSKQGARFQSRRKKGSRQTNVPRNMRSMSQTSPPKTTVWMGYKQTLQLTSTLATGHRAYYLESNHAFQVDPFATSTTPGFASYAARYASYRVRAYKGSISFENNSIASTLGFSSGSTFVCHANTNLGVTSGGSNTAIQSFAALGRNSMVPLPAVGGPAAVHRFNRSVSSVTGESVSKDAYKSLVNGAPADLTYLVFGFEMPATGFTGNIPQCAVSVNLEILVDFLDFIDTLTSFVQNPKCAACAYAEGAEYTPCRCGTRSACLLCGWTRPCSELHPVATCPISHTKALLTPPSSERRNSL